MSSPLHGVFLWFSNARVLAARALVNATKQILAAYYERQGLNHPRKVNRIKILYDSEKRRLVFKFRSYPTPASNHKPNITLQFDGIGTQAGTKTAEEVFPLSPWDDAREFTAEGWSIDEDQYHGMFRRMKDFSHLRLENLDISPVLRALSSENRGTFKIVIRTARFTYTRVDEPQPLSLPKLNSLVLSHLRIDGGEFLGVLKQRRDCNAPLKRVIIESCTVLDDARFRTKLKELVKVKLSDLRVLRLRDWKLPRDGNTQMGDRQDG